VVAGIFIAVLIVVVGFLVLLDSLVPGLGVQTLVFVGAALSALLALVGVLITQGVNVYTAWSGQKRELENTREGALQTYLNETKIPGGLSDRQSSREEPSEAEQSDNGRAAAMAKAHSLLLRLDRNRKRILLQFFHEAKLIERVKDRAEGRPLIELSGANLSGANLRGIDLGDDSLRGADLSGADLREADLSGADLRDAKLGVIGWNDAGITALISIYVRDFISNNRKLGSADLREADLSDADLRGAKGLTEERITLARGNETTQLPEDLVQYQRVRWGNIYPEQPSNSTNDSDTGGGDTAAQHRDTQ